MPNQYQQFEVDGITVDLMTYNPRQDHSPVSAASALVDSIGGFYDVYGAAPARAQRQTISLSGTVFGELTYLVDEDGDYIVDEDNDYLIAGDALTMLRSQLAAMRSAVRKLGTLWRMRLEWGQFGGEVREWKTARFLRMSQPQVVGDRLLKAEVTCDFETHMSNWHAEEATTYSIDTTLGDWDYIAIENPGELVNDAVLTVTQTSGAIIAVVIRSVGMGIDLTWTGGTLGTGQSLVIDSRSVTLPDGIVDAFGGILLDQTNHTVAGWLPIPSGAHSLGIYVNGGTATVTLSYYVQVP